MDQVFSKIFENLSVKNDSPLVILTGDHGMRDSGGHGGSTYSETHVPFGVLGVPCDEGLIDQVDIAPNLAVLLGLEIPSSSIGKLTKLLLKNLPIDEFVSALFYNAKLLSLKHSGSQDEFESISKLFKSYLEKSDVTVAKKLIASCTEYTKRVSRSLVETSTEQDIMSMVVSVILLFYSLIVHLKRRDLFRSSLYNYLFHILIVVFRVFAYDEIVFILATLASLYLLKADTNFHFKITTHVLVFSIFLQPLTWLSSSFIEEEHEFWYFIMNTFLVFQISKKIKEKEIAAFLEWISITTVFRFAQTLNQVGDKWASLSDSSDFLLKPENFHSHLSLLCFSIIGIYLFCLKFGKGVYHLDKLILFLIFIYKVNESYQIFLARMIYILLMIHLIVSFDYLNSWILLITFLLKSYNTCLIPLSVYTSGKIFDEYKVGITATCFHLILSKCLYFMQGNGNNIANIDIAVGYTALSGYQPVIVGVQLLINIYSTTILIHLLLLNSSNNKRTLNFVYSERLYVTIVICFVSIIFRNHIFIWTVYAPKLCIEFCHTFVFVAEFLFYVSVSSVITKKIALNK